MEFNRSFCQGDAVARLARRLLAEVVEVCKASEATLWVASADGHYLEGALNCGQTPEILENSAVPVDGSVVGMVFCTGMATSIGPDDPHNPSIDEKTGLPTRAMAVAPVCVEGRTCGVLSVMNPADGGLFSADDMEHLHWKAHLMGLLLADMAREAVTDDAD